MTEIGTVLFALALIVAFFFPRIAAGIALVSSVLCLPLYLYFIAPVHFSRIFRLDINSKFRRARTFM
jgi:hypothetical protein